VAHKLNLKNDTRIRLIKPKQYYWNFEVQKAWLKIFMLSCIVRIWIWNLNPKQFKILAKFWRWNHTKTMHQIILINFLNLMRFHRFISFQDCTLIVFDLSFFFYFEFCFTFFFTFSNTSICLDPEFHNFYPMNFNFIRKNSQHRFKNRGSLILELKTVLRNFKNTIEVMYKNLCGSSTQAWTQI